MQKKYWFTCFISKPTNNQWGWVGRFPTGENFDMELIPNERIFMTFTWSAMVLLWLSKWPCPRPLPLRLYNRVLEHKLSHCYQHSTQFLQKGYFDWVTRKHSSLRLCFLFTITSTTHLKNVFTKRLNLNSPFLATVRWIYLSWDIFDSINRASINFEQHLPHFSVFHSKIWFYWFFHF